VFAPFVLREELDDFREAKYVSVMVDSSNHSNLKLVPVLVRYFASTRGIQVKVIEFQNVTGKTSEILVSHILSVLEKYKITEKVIAFCGDNCNTNFGGLARKGKNNVFYRLNNSLKMNILGVGCAVHLIHNALKTSADMLPVDVESIIINKIFRHFHIFTVRVEELKTFCNFVEVEYKSLLGSVKTRWLSLLPALERTIEMFDGLKSYFLSQEKSPKILKDFFNDPQSILYLRFIHRQIKLCTNTIKKIEEEDICGSKVAEELRMLKDHIFNRKEQQFFMSAILE
jgi:hypothetical protein